MPRFNAAYSAIRWCGQCNIPLMGKKCGICGSDAEDIQITPPGDARPGFDFDRNFIMDIVDAQYGEGTGMVFMPEGHVFLLNRAPSEDRMDEIISDGSIIGTLKYDISSGWRVMLRMEGASRVVLAARKGVITSDPGAVGPVLDGKNLMAPGVIASRGDVENGDEVIVVDPDGAPIGVGTARQSTPQLIEGRGQGIKVRWKGQVEHNAAKTSTWGEVVQANRDALFHMEKRSVAFVKKVVEENSPLPVAVSVSGGKDSLATLLAVLAADMRPSLLFCDTGLEFQETLDNVKETAETYGLDLFVESAGDAFWTGLDTFGPPAKDFRWCCKSCKLGPATRLIKENFPNGVLSFIGQRAKESVQRSKKGSVWKNPWVPNQIGASPIQNWSALDVWLYIFSKDAKYNPIYERGLHRIGCWLCPSSDKGDAEMAGKLHPDGRRWADYLSDYVNEKGKPREWLTLGMWRWKRLPPWAKGMVPEDDHSVPKDESVLSLVLASGYQPCTDGISIEGVFNRHIDIEKASNILNILGKIRINVEEGWIETAEGKVQVFREGGLVVRAFDEKTARDLAQKTRNLLIRGELCIGCGVCLGACPVDALSLDDKRIFLDVEKCTLCERCMKKCPVVDFGSTEEWQG